MGLNYISIYEGDEDPKKHWFIYEMFWAPNNISDENKQIAHFVAAFQKWALTWFMNITKN